MVIYLDTETSSLNPGNIVELSYIMQQNEKVCAKNFFFTVDHVDSQSESIHGFSKELLFNLSNGKRFKDQLEEIKEDLMSASLLVAHNASFDMNFLKSEFLNNGEILELPECYCTMKNSLEICKIPRCRGYKYPKLSELCDYYGISTHEIEIDTKRFYQSDSSFHDARFDTTALFLCANYGMERGFYKKIKDNLL